MDTSATSPPHPFLTQPILYCSGFPSSTPNESLVEALADCLRCRLSIQRDPNDSSAPAQGLIEFESLHKAEQAYATVNGQKLSPSGSLILSLTPPPSSDPLPSPNSQPRLVKQLPFTLTPPTLYNLTRPFGPLYSLTLLLAPPPPHAPPGIRPRFRGQAVVKYYSEEDAIKMQEGLHFAEIEGQNVAVSVWDQTRAERNRARRSDVSTTTMSGTPARLMNGGDKSPSVSPGTRTSRWAADQQSSGAGEPSPSTPLKYPSEGSVGAGEFRPSSAQPQSRVMGRTVSGASQWSMASSVDESGGGRKNEGIDPCNLFIKSLPSSLISPHLHTLFSPYGSIISARVMTEPLTSLSREFGFVSFSTAEEADAALRGMDGSWVAVDQGGEVKRGDECRGIEGAKRVTVRVHERKEVRQARMNGAGSGSGEGIWEETGVQEMERSFGSLSTATPTKPLPRPQGLVHPAPASPSPSLSPSATRNASPSASKWASHPAAVAAPAPPPSPSPAATDSKSEKERLREGVEKVKEVPLEKLDEVVGLLESLPKKDRALALFNPSILAQKALEALSIIDVADSPPDSPTSAPVPASVLANVAPAAPSERYAVTLDSLAPLPSAEILSLLRSSSSALLAGLTPPNEEEVKEMDHFMDGLEGSPVNVVKQKLGERVFKGLKAGGVKGAPRITIHLLDTEFDLRALAQVTLWNEVLKAKGEAVGREMKK
ncbi:hypothetical protein JCM11641_000790 [Rhodosporidiobolus odoratus]